MLMLVLMLLLMVVELKLMLVMSQLLGVKQLLSDGDGMPELHEMRRWMRRMRKGVAELVVDILGG